MSDRRFPCVYEVYVEAEDWTLVARRRFSLPFVPFKGLRFLGMAPDKVFVIEDISWDVVTEEFALEGDNSPWWLKGCETSQKCRAEFGNGWEIEEEP
jgi:hypothetical protein